MDTLWNGRRIRALTVMDTGTVNRCGSKWITRYMTNVLRVFWSSYAARDVARI
ncbi:hypothetical protein [Paludibacterium denitrificans]|uniref:hypothetical protein n=1 Tax=Paludibacterium denitrificans TaxID=2675226 RepID=UPI001E318B79|nr:hypothetical protein [Paludibacterium denitrificans]